MNDYIRDAEMSGSKGILLYLDLDDFKNINDGLGHQYGDMLLKTISQTLKGIEGIEKACYRVGGDEFIIIISPAIYSSFHSIVGKIMEIFSKPWYLKEGDYYCTMSMGIVCFPDDGRSFHELMKKADIAMYEAKKRGKNRVAQYTDNIDSASGKRLDMEKNMRDATAAGY
ncbi:MAG: GGDEF domain-containing protein, partial [Alistipes sp.]|nr:GGDEF domain-containing protein [Alistipes sp.]